MPKVFAKRANNTIIKPRRFYEELAEYGILEDYLLERHKDKYGSDVEFRNEMQDILLKHSTSIVPSVEISYLEKLCESLSFFLEYIKPCLNRKP